MRWKATGLVILTTIFAFFFVYLLTIQNFQRSQADVLQVAGNKTVQPNQVETADLGLYLDDNQTEAKIGQEVFYQITWEAKRDIKGARLVGVLGATTSKIRPNFLQELGDLKKGASGSFQFPLVIQKGDSDFVLARITLSEVEKPFWWGKEKRKSLGIVDDIDRLSQ